MAQYECFTQDMYNHQEDIAKYAALEGLKEAGVYALADEVYYDVFDGITIDFDDNNMDIEDFATEAQTAIHDAMDEPLYDALGSNDEILEDGELSGGIEEVIAIRTGQRREEARSEDGRVTLKGEAQASRAASEKLAEGRDTGSPARDDHSIV